MHLFHFYHRHHTQRQSAFWLFELSIWAHMFARSLIAIFIPILLIKIGYSIGEVMIYFLLFSAFDVPLNFFARWCVLRYGAKYVIVIATMLTIVFLTLFMHLPPDSWHILFLMALCSALYDALYWVAYIFFFMQSDTSVDSTGKNTGILHAVRKSAGLLGPALGAVLLVFVSRDALFAFSIAVFALSLWPLAKMKHVSDKPLECSLRRHEFFADTEGKQAYISTALYAIHDSVETWLFPLFIFTVFGTIESVALIPVVVSVTAIVVALVLGNIKHDKRHVVLSVGALILALIWLLRLFVDSGLFFYLSVSAVGFFTFFILVPLDIGIFEHANRVRDPLSAATYRNAVYMIVNVCIFGIMVILINLFHVSFITAALGLFALAAFEVVAASKRAKQKSA